MHPARYLQSTQFQRYISDWITTFCVYAYFFLVAENTQPFQRQFKLNDSTIQHPFVTQERVSGLMCIILAIVVPSLVMTSVTIIKYKNKSKTHMWHILQVSVLGLALAVAVDGVITDILKCWVGRPRPDFLDRCGPTKGTPVDKFVDISVCTAPLGVSLLTDGMRSTPSGHSSISFSAFLYLSMWLYGQFQITKYPRDIHLHILSGLPLLLAAYVALSRVQDYRHHFVDIFVGGAMGCLIARTVYHKYFHSITSDRSRDILGDEEDGVLPL